MRKIRAINMNMSECWRQMIKRYYWKSIRGLTYEVGNAPVDTVEDRKILHAASCLSCTSDGENIPNNGQSLTTNAKTQEGTQDGPIHSDKIQRRITARYILEWRAVSLSVSTDTQKNDAARRMLLVVKLDNLIDSKGGASQNNLYWKEARQNSKDYAWLTRFVKITKRFKVIYPSKLAVAYSLKH